MNIPIRLTDIHTYTTYTYIRVATENHRVEHGIQKHTRSHFSGAAISNTFEPFSSWMVARCVRACVDVYCMYKLYACEFMYIYNAEDM